MTVLKGEVWLADLNPQKRPGKVSKVRPMLNGEGDTLNRSKYPTIFVMPFSTSVSTGRNRCLCV
jgi:hypothetical protein